MQNSGQAKCLGPIQEPPFQRINPISLSSGFLLLCKRFIPPSPSLQSPALHWAVRFYSLGVRSRSSRNAKSVISFLTGSNNRLTAVAGAKSGASMFRGTGKSKQQSLSLKEKKSPQSASGMGERFCWGRCSSGLLWAHFSVTCGNSPLCSAHRAGNIFLEFFQNTLQVWRQDNGPVGGGPGAGARLLGPRLSGFSTRQSKAPRRWDSGGFAKLRRAAKAAGVLRIHRRVSPPGLSLTVGDNTHDPPCPKVGAQTRLAVTIYEGRWRWLLVCVCPIIILSPPLRAALFRSSLIGFENEQGKVHRIFDYQEVV